MKNDKEAHPPCYICGEPVKVGTENFVTEEDGSVFCHEKCCPIYRVQHPITPMCYGCVWFRYYKVRRLGN